MSARPTDCLDSVALGWIWRKATFRARETDRDEGFAKSE
jgi:hypothetical protein